MIRLLDKKTRIIRYIEQIGRRWKKCDKEIKIDKSHVMNHYEWKSAIENEKEVIILISWKCFNKKS